MRENKGASFVWVILGVALAFAGSLLLAGLFSGNEDTWICADGAWVKHGNPRSAMPSEPCDSTSLENKFNKTGLLIKNEGDDLWTLVYDEPGASDTIKYLSFNGKSQCEVGGSLVTCEDNMWNSGMRGTVSGVLEDESVLVIKLEVY